MATATTKENTKAAMTSMSSTSALQSSIRSHKGHFTRERRFLQDLASGDYPDRVRLDNLVDGLQSRIEKIADLVHEISNHDAELALEYQTLLDELVEQLGVAGRLVSSVGRNEPQVDQVTNRSTHFKPASDLKPPMLSQESTPPDKPNGRSTSHDNAWKFSNRH